MVILDEKIGKTVGRRLKPDSLAVVPGMQEDAQAWKDLAGAPRHPKGVFWFKTHEEADAWSEDEVMWRPKLYCALGAALCAVILWNKGIPLSAGTFSRGTSGLLLCARIALAVASAYFSLRVSLKGNRHHVLNIITLVAILAGGSVPIYRWLEASRYLHLFLYQPSKGGESVILSSLSTPGSDTDSVERRQAGARAAFRLNGITLLLGAGCFGLLLLADIGWTNFMAFRRRRTRPY